MTDLDSLLARGRLLPVLTVAGPSIGSAVAEALLTAGLPLAEVTLRVDGALEALRAMAALELTVGAGTVVTPDQVDRAVEAGASFVVSPGLHAAVVERCRDLGVPVLPGIATASDLMLAVELGVETVKMFPADLVGGPAAVKAFTGPFPAMRFVPTGGIGPAQLSSYLSLPAVLAVGGSWLAPRDVVAAGRWDEITRRTRQALQQIDEERVR
ncbi:bifunctional 4-hydroxy-2-oxoglutarate aldolase/2-dehydro-3-deoxy-phosphogluconate aldolase [Nocardioides panaciterrulae]|uniref:2-dehydro-3-deoxy-phosphogluconate aldolase n=1 Tax=Nocardioides panaciterrulae TaxID=661492 RepID=A0A7Y9E8B1_9ACTN|nr:2-dehydro-3-deoxyphosphogluconate aldolase/(4S)-4-hydroxy-2-oxoglutarate aldolase [Nocardioides panaciterrulae]